MDLHVTFTSRRDLVGQLHRQIRAAIVEGRLRPGERLPATREFAERLGVSRYTVGVAYDRLVADGLVQGRAGAGSFVTEQPKDATELRAPATALRPTPIWASIRAVSGLDATPRYDFRAGLPDARLFPFKTWRRLMAEQLRGSVVGRGNYGEPAGDSRLRAAIARHVGVARGVIADAEDVVVTTGCQQAVDLIARVLLAPGDTVAVEAPGYQAPRELLRSHGLHVVGVRVDAEGLVVDELPDDARLVYVTPSHQFPLGMAMTAARRMALLAWAEAHGAAVIEDDYDSEFRYGAGTVDPLLCLDHSGRVIYVGTFAKTMLPALRLGFLIAPPSLRTALRKAKYVSDWHTAQPTQGALAEFISSGMFARHIRSMRRAYGVRHELITEVLRREFTDWLTPVDSSVGLHIAALAPRHSVTQITGVIQRAAANGVGIFRLSAFGYGDHVPAGFVIGYGAIAPEDIEDGLRHLRDALPLARSG
ncbi:MAG TPA: PLP-dependent aminotransferase family protein [Micromonosporaceae bacterium]